MATEWCQPRCATCAGLRAAALELVDRGGLDAVTGEQLATRSGLDLDDVRRHYRTASECVWDAYDEISHGIHGYFARAFRAERGWRRALRSAAAALLERMSTQPAEARLWFVEALRGDHELLRRREAARTRLVELFVSELRLRTPAGDTIAELQIELLIGAGFQAIAAAVEAGRTAELPALAPELETRAHVFEPVAA